MIVYVYSKCSTCKDALKLLQKLKVSPDIREITITPPSVNELKTMLHFQNDNLKKLFNTSGNLYREMQLAEKLSEMPLKNALELLSSHGMLVKRPFLLGTNFGLLGFNPKEWTSKLQSFL